MAQIATNNGNKRGKKGKFNKSPLRVDFTPMVDMNMLLITFFMFCTTLSKPQMMDIVMPTKLPGKTVAPQSRSTTLILGENDKVYYFFGEANYNDPDFLNKVMVTDYSAEGLRAMLLEKNTEVVQMVKDLSTKKYYKQISDEEFQAEKEKINKSDKSQTVIIKPSDKSAYKNLIDVLDEVRICSINKYAVVDYTPQDDDLIKLLNDNAKMAQAK
ncbi:biopolymer transporter ExbD [Dysgonomonas sp. 520]|uniref:ExbD/TolR family protein n=1 Tax=Dysgonomonas sp. 520 TaxID=2302931 RepID=UPI0013D18146|nr:biopolymer transporter ExbD [Dysgonomonas sp. 520]NDW09307.1 biopolymer transporter ExbD [Dysgonomonas sp. 520]